MNLQFGLVLHIVVGFVGIVLCISWGQLLSSYRKLSAAKFKVIHGIERNLPIRPFDAEWRYVGDGKDKRLYRPLSNIETTIPWIFGGLYILLMAISVVPSL